MTIAERIINLERAYNVREGMRRGNDVLPRRLMKEAMPSGPAKGNVVELDGMLDEFYEVCGWDTNGIPSQQTLLRLGLSEAAGDMATAPATS